MILTPTGYKPISEIQVGDIVSAFDVFTGEQIENEVLDKQLWNTSPESPFFNGNFYVVNETWQLYSEQSIWRNDNQVVHIKDLVIGDTIFDENDNNVTITSIRQTTSNEWYRFEISGDHSFIQDGLTLHNASRFWVGGTGTWSSGNTTNWSGTTGGAGGSSVPTSADTATFDASSGGGTVTPDYDMTVTSITMGAFTGTLDFGTTSPTMQTFSGTGTGTRTLNMGSGTWTLTGNAATIWSTATTTNLTLNAGTSTIISNYSGSTGTRTLVGNIASSIIVGNLSISAGSDSITMTNMDVVNLDFTGFTGTVNGGGATTNIRGNLTLGAGMTMTDDASNGYFFPGTPGTQIITTNGVTVGKNLTFSGLGGTRSLADNLVCSNTIDLSRGTFNTNNFNVTCKAFSSSNSNVRSLVMGSSTFTLTGTGTVWNTGTTTNLTLTPGTSNITINDATIASKTFTGGGLTFANITTSGDNIIITGSNTFSNFALNNAGQTTGTTLTAGTTTTVSSFTNNGSAGNLTKLISSSAGTPATLSKSSGTVSVNYMSIKDSTATGGAAWYAGANSTNVSGNTGWFFIAAPSGGVTIGNSMANSIFNGILI